MKNIITGFFSEDELKSSLNRAHDTAEGPDKIHYQLLKHLPTESMALLLDIFNYIWQFSRLLERGDSYSSS